MRVLYQSVLSVPSHSLDHSRRRPWHKHRINLLVLALVLFHSVVESLRHIVLAHTHRLLDVARVVRCSLRLLLHVRSDSRCRSLDLTV